MFKSKEKFLLLILLIAAAAVRGFLLFRDLEYDEIWSLENYAILPLTKIFSDLATPNNHPINTLLIKLLWFGKENFWMIRIGSLLFSLGSIGLLFLLGRKLFNRTAAWYAAVAGAFLPPMIISGTTARGYAGEIFFLLCFAYSLINSRRGSVIWSIAAAVSGLLAIISLPTAVLYIAPVAIFYLLYLWKKRKIFPVQTVIFSLAALLCAVWFSINFNSFIQQKQFKAEISCFNEFFQWFYSAMAENGIWLWLLPIIFIITTRRKICWILSAVILFPLAAAVITSPGPARVYLPAAAAGIMLCGSVSTAKKWRYHLMLILLIQQILISYPERTEEKKIGRILNAANLNNSIKIYPPTAGYPLRWNHPESVETFFTSLISAAQKDICILFVPEKDKISGVSLDGNTVSLPLPFSLQNNQPYVLRLQKTQIVPANTLAFAIFPPMPQENLKALYRNLNPAKVIFLNNWLTIPLKTAESEIHKYMMFAFILDRDVNFSKGYPVYIPLEK